MMEDLILNENRASICEKPSLNGGNQNQQIETLQVDQTDNHAEIDIKTELKDSTTVPVGGFNYNDNNFTGDMEHINSAVIAAGFVIPASFQVSEKSPTKDTEPTPTGEILINNVRSISELSNSGLESRNYEESISNSSLPSDSQNILIPHESGDHGCDESENLLVTQEDIIIENKSDQDERNNIFDENVSQSGSNVTEIDSELAEDDDLRENITDQLKSVSLSNIFVNNLYKYISKEKVFKMLQYGQKKGILTRNDKSVQSLGWKIKQLKVLKKELTGVEDRMDDDIVEPKVGIGRGRRKKRKTKKRLKDEENDEPVKPMDKNDLARALDLRVNSLEGEFGEDETENEVETDSRIINEVPEIIQPKRRGRKPGSKSVETDPDVIINEKRNCRGRNVPQQFEMDWDEYEPEPEKEKPKRGRRPSVKNSSNSNPITRIKKSALPNETISPSVKSKKKIKLIIDRFESANLMELTPKNLYQFLTKSQVVEYLEFGKQSQFIDFDALKQPVVWRLEQLKLLQNKLVDYNQKVKQHEAEYKRMRRQDPEYRERERQRNKEAKRKLRQDPEYRKQELINMTRARQLAKFRKLQLEFIEQEELMLEKRLLEGSNFPPPTPTPAPTPMSLYDAQTPMPIDPDPEPEIIEIPSDQAPQSHEYNLNEGTGQFDIHGHHENSNTSSMHSMPVHLTTHSEFMDNNNSQHSHELKQSNNYVTVTRDDSPHCGMMVTQQQTHSEHMVSVTNEMRPPSNDFSNNVGNQLMVPMHVPNADHQHQHQQQHDHQQEQHHRMLIDHNDYTCMSRENVVYHHHEMVQNKFVHRPDPHNTHSAMSDHNVSFTSLLINNQLLDCELQGDHE